MTNRLINESSPYLRQHAHNPVDWYPWGEEALSRSKDEDKPILLSIGYSACHWCHVMERESFENVQIAALMNQNFINIKVDREERPDLDAVYMQAVQAMTGHGGWPMTVFLTPDGKPFYGGTYFPPEDRHGMVGFPRLMLDIAEAYRSSRHEVEHAAEQLCERLRRVAQASAPTDGSLDGSVFDTAFIAMLPHFDHRNGGIGGAPKFPHPMVYEFLLRHHARTGEPRALVAVEHTLERMAYGGIYDHIGGGFHRYSTDEEWLIPHFEKMLYDNALLARLYLHAYQVTGRPLFRQVVEETLDYVLREMTSHQGGFYATQDADAGGVEGAYYAWRPEEIEQLVGVSDTEFICKYFGVTSHGNFEGMNVLHVTHSLQDVAQSLAQDESAMEERLRMAKKILLDARSKRVSPSRDEKVITGWNGLVLRTLSEAASVLNREDYRRAAIANAAFILQHLCKDGRLMRVYKDGEAKVSGYLEDYACVVDGLVALHEATFDPRWLHEARALADTLVELFWDDSKNVFYDTSLEHEQLLVRPREFLDMVTPSGGSVATSALLHLGVVLGHSSYTRLSTMSLEGIQRMVARSPLGFGQWLCAMDFATSTPKEVAVIGSWEDPSTHALRASLFRPYMPNKVVAGVTTENDLHAIPLIDGKRMLGGRPTAYVCHNFTCKTPTTEAIEMERQLSG